MSDVALLVIDVQESFRHRPFWNDADVPPFTERLQALIDGAAARQIPVLQVFHVAESGPFAIASGHVRTLEPVVIAPTATFHKRRHSALVETGDSILIDIPNRGITLETPEAVIAERRAAQLARGKNAWKPSEQRQRQVSPALRAYAAMTTNAARGAVRDVSQIEK